MNKKIKIIELLNKIANGEEMPKKIEYQGEIYEWDEEALKYADHTGYTLEIYTKKIDLHEEVEILEDNTEEIEELNGSRFVLKPLDEEMINKINELVKAVNQIRKEKNK